MTVTSEKEGPKDSAAGDLRKTHLLHDELQFPA